MLQSELPGEATMIDAAAFLAAKLDELEAAANEAAEHSRQPLVPRWDHLNPSPRILVGDPVDDRPTPEQRMIDAHRKLLELHAPLAFSVDPDLACPYCDFGLTAETWPCLTIRCSPRRTGGRSRRDR